MGESLAAKATRSQPAIFLKASAGPAPRPSIAHATKTERVPHSMLLRICSSSTERLVCGLSL